MVYWSLGGRSLIPLASTKLPLSLPDGVKSDDIFITERGLLQLLLTLQKFKTDQRDEEKHEEKT